MTEKNCNDVFDTHKIWAETLPQDSNDLRERVIWVIEESVVSGRARYTYLEQQTGIAARKWKNLCNRLQQPSIEMISALAIEFRPYFLEWMVTGKVMNSMQVDPYSKESLELWRDHRSAQAEELVKIFQRQRAKKRDMKDV